MDLGFLPRSAKRPDNEGFRIMNWVHPFDRDDSPEMRLLWQACQSVAAAAKTTLAGQDIDAPEWAWSAIEAAKENFPGFDWQTAMCPAWQAEKALAYAQAKEQQAQSAAMRAASIEAAARAGDMEELVRLKATTREIPLGLLVKIQTKLWHKKYNPSSGYWTKGTSDRIERR